MSEHLEGVAAAPAPPTLSEGQRLIDELNEQAKELVLLQRLVARLRTGIIATPAPSAKVVVQIPPPVERQVSFFAGIDIVKRSNAAAISATMRDVEDLARIFAVSLSEAFAEHREEETHVGSHGG